MWTLRARSLRRSSSLRTNATLPLFGVELFFVRALVPAARHHARKLLMGSLFPPNSAWIRSRSPLRDGLSAAFAACAAAGAVCASDIRLRIQTLDDLNRAVPGTAFEVLRGPNDSVEMRTNEQGQHAFPVICAESSTVRVTLGETASGGGTTVGQRLQVLIPAAQPAFEQSNFIRGFHQPVALPIFLSSKHPATPEPNHLRWRFAPIEGGADIGANVGVALLLTANEIAGYESYYGVSFPQPASTSYTLGLVIKSTSAVQLGSKAPIALMVDLAGHGVSTLPCATTFHVSPSAVAANPYTFSVTGGFWDAVNECGYYSLTGKLERGDNVILFGGCGAPSARLQSSPPALDPPIIAPVTDCSPPSPSPPTPWSCTPDSPAPRDGCPAFSIGSQGCNTSTVSVDSTVCGDAGDTHSVWWRWHRGGSVSIPLRIAGTTVTVAGDYSWEFEIRNDVHIWRWYRTGPMQEELDSRPGMRTTLPPIS